MTRPHAKPRGDAPAPPPRGRPDEPSAPPPPFDTPATTADALEAHRDTVDALEKELKQASIDAGMSEVRVAFAREILDHAEREHQANVLRYDSVMVALQEAPGYECDVRIKLAEAQGELHALQTPSRGRVVAVRAARARRPSSARPWRARRRCLTG